LFSAKEALYKCLFPEVGRVFDYLDAELRDVDCQRRTIRLRLTAPLSARWRRGDEIAGRATVDGGVVFTAVVLEEPDDGRDARS
jgi:4'-phosphopantetheinyl transferase EntD